MSDTKSFWTTLPGVLSGIAGVIGAIVSLLLVLMQLKIIEPSTNGPPTENESKQTPAPPTFSPDPLTGQAEDLENQIRELTFKINELEKEWTSSPMPAGLLHELEYHKKEYENKIVEFDQMLVAKRQEINELRRHENTDPDVRARIQRLEDEAIPDLEVGKRYVENELKKMIEEIPKARKKKELKETLYELREKKQVLQNQLDRLTRPKEPKL